MSCEMQDGNALTVKGNLHCGLCISNMSEEGDKTG